MSRVASAFRLSSYFCGTVGHYLNDSQGTDYSEY